MGQIMSITIIVVASLFTAFEFLSVIGKMSKSLLKKVLGYEYLIDIIMSFGLMLYFGLVGSVTGMIVSAVSGFIFSIALYSAKHIVGYSKLHRVQGTWFKFQWVDYPADWNSKKKLEDLFQNYLELLENLLLISLVVLNHLKRSNLMRIKIYKSIQLCLFTCGICSCKIADAVGDAFYWINSFLKAYLVYGH